MITIVLGNFKANAAQDAELCLILPKSYAPWDAANRVAGFLDTWLETALLERSGSVESLNYVVNELMENAVKYAHAGSIELSVGFEVESLRVSLVHPVSSMHAVRYREMADDLIARDPDELFAEIIERNALNDAVTQHGGGLGLVSLRQNYQAELGFGFQDLLNDLVLATTQVCLPWPNQNDLRSSLHTLEFLP